MPMYICPLYKCQLTLKFGVPAVCPMRAHALQSWEPQGLTVNFHTGCAAIREFKDAAFRMESFMPATQRGLFDMSMFGGGNQIVITVKVHARFTMPPQRDWGPLLKDSYAALQPWADNEKVLWTAEQQTAIDDVWNASPFKLRLSMPGAWVRDFKPSFRIAFTAREADAHIVADVEKSPPINPDMFNCGGSRLNLAQIITGNPKAVSAAALTSQSGQPVAMNSAVLGHKEPKVPVTVMYNIVAHEYGHMLGLPDEYNSGGEIKGTDRKANAYAIHCQATDKLAARAGTLWKWNERTDSLMSTGNVVNARHLITIWEAAVVATSRYTVAHHWSIV